MSLASRTRERGIQWSHHRGIIIVVYVVTDKEGSDVKSGTALLRGIDLNALGKVRLRQTKGRPKRGMPMRCLGSYNPTWQNHVFTEPLWRFVILAAL